MQETHKSSSVYVTAASAKPVKVQTRWVCYDTAQVLAPDQLKQAYEYGGEKVRVAAQASSK